MAAGSLSQENPLGDCMAPHSSVLAWSVPWTELPRGLQSMGHTEFDRTEGTYQACTHVS